MKKYNTIFNFSENPTFDFIHINNQKVKVRLYLNGNKQFELSFTYNGKAYSLILDPIPHKDYQIEYDKIDFNDLVLNQVEQIKLSNRLNEIIDYNEG